MSAKPDLVVFSHLRWDFVFQRPQHLMTRLADARRVLFVEEPVYAEGATPAWSLSHPNAGVTVCRLTTPCPAPGFDDAHEETMRPLLRHLLQSEGVGSFVAWYYTPMALPLARGLAPALTVYDCMDELSAFRGAPRELLVREQELLSAADLMFTGGPSLYRAKRGRHPDVHCFPSSVDAAHFRAAHDPRIEADDIEALPRPRLGFYGVIDERMDLELIAAVAEARPQWQIVLVGPVVKIDPESLPRAHNIHYVGQRGYAELPSYLAGWDVCLLPFARNEATRFISPTKTLEYMAAGKPIVSTPIADVAEPYGDVVYLAETADAFVAACERALHAPNSERLQRAQRMHAVLAETSWDTTAAAMDELMSRRAASRSARLVA